MKTFQKAIFAITAAGAFLFFGSRACATEFTLASPDNSLKVTIRIEEAITYRVSKSGETILLPSPLSMTLRNKVLGHNATVLDKTFESIDEVIKPVWGQFSEIDNTYNELQVDFEGSYSLTFRAYNEGVAYRWKTDFKQEIIIESEEVCYRFDKQPDLWLPQKRSFETDWERGNIQEMGTSRNYPGPLLIELTSRNKVLITEADVLDYPTMLLNKAAPQEAGIKGSFERYPLRTKWGGFEDLVQISMEAADYIARTEGSRSFPWRILIVTDEDKDLLDNQMVFKLATDQQLKSTDWITPGKVAWEWWHNYKLDGVDFKPGVNTETYLYHVDFAAEFGLEYVLIDWKWTDLRDLTKVNPEVDIKGICQYAAKKNVKVIVWAPAYALDMDLENVLDLYKSFGISGIKTDFFNREDQLANRMYQRMAKAAADREFIVNFHGCTKPNGLSKMYPNVLNYEAVRGNEHNKWKGISLEHHLHIAFMRMLCGTMDFTPGGMRNAGKGEWRKAARPVVSGTRAHQAAMYVVYFEALKTLADSPTAYEKESDFTKFIAAIPTTWDETEVLAGKFGEYIAIARQTGTTWYVGLMNNWEPRTLQVDLSFLEPGNFFATILKDDPIHTRKDPSRFKFETKKVQKGTVIDLPLASGGGAVIRIDPR